ncbi:MAG: undecaprenyldiphospho-muramoylpentapeptide beta-N-acetylglucosaminyltransferase [Sorangiineae bacterium]|nr:undecaprenyldiphospho-muramoylpentapeptide beta-N-acetylglucosaminyltransferase [Polyangiaceae bacterium]MEB2322741.1 undecaprenyldiphospho-muramoylpentapeptide beta-N-acetylglucosaminyltransferase [Sorangiineae bacterium]
MSATILLAGGGTGGHVFPMIAVADALRRLEPTLALVFVGTERGIETRVVPERGYPLELMRVLPIRGGGVGGALRGVSRALGAVPEARALLRRHAPGAVFSIGGYAAGPIALAARTLGVPLALMEPNAVIGLANRLTAPIVTRAYTAFPEPERHFAERKVLRSGVPIRDGFDARPYSRSGGPLRVLVLGGSQGAQALNEAVPGALAHLRTELAITHQAGPAHGDAVRARYRGRAEVVSFIEDMPAALAAADLVVGRSGASAVAEICAVGRPSVLVPYPFAAGDHQRKNAESLAAAGAAVCVPASEATPARLASEIDRLAETPGALEAMATAAERVGRPQAALAVARDLLALAGLELGAPRAAAASEPESRDGGPLASEGAS